MAASYDWLVNSKQTAYIAELCPKLPKSIHAYIAQFLYRMRDLTYTAGPRDLTFRLEICWTCYESKNPFPCFDLEATKVYSFEGDNIWEGMYTYYDSKGLDFKTFADHIAVATD